MAVKICTAVIVEDAAAVTAAIVKGKFAMAINNRVGGRLVGHSLRVRQTPPRLSLHVVSLGCLSGRRSRHRHPSSNGTPLWTVVVRPVACLRGGAKWALRYLHFVLAKSTLVAPVACSQQLAETYDG